MRQCLHLSSIFIDGGVVDVGRRVAGSYLV